MFKLFVLCLAVATAMAEPSVHFKDDFSDSDWESRWTQSNSKTDYGKWKLSAGRYYADAEKDQGLQTSQDAKFYAISSSFDKFSNKDKNLVVQFSVKHEQSIDCGGGYVKLFPSTLKSTDMTGDSEYNIMFGPDICGPGTKKVHVIFQYKGKNLLIKKDIRCKDDVDTHVYTLIVKPDNTYSVLIDNKEAQTGSLEEHWDFLEPKEIKDPSQSKPEDWEDREQITDPEDTKPADFDKPQYIPDPEAEKPDDWDDETDGEWEPSQIDNPEYKGEWTPKEIPNPDYKGPWVHPMIANPEYSEDSQLYSYEDFGVIGLDLWQVKSGTVFSNFLITDDVETAKAACQEVLDTTVKGELAMKEEVEEANRKIEEEAEKAKAAEEEADEDDDESMGEIDDDEEDNVVEASPEVAAEVTPEVAAEEPAAATGKDEL